MEEKDLKQIQEAVREEVKDFVTKDDIKDLATKSDVKSAIGAGLIAFWEHNLEPTFDALDERLTIVEHKLDKALYSETERITKLENKMKVIEEKLGISSG